MNLVKKYASLVKFSHTVFALPFAIIGFFIGLNPAVFRPNNSMKETVNSSLFLSIGHAILFNHRHHKKIKYIFF